MILDVQDLKSFLDDQRDLIADLNISVTNLYRLRVNKYEFESQIKLHGFFQHHSYQLRFIAIIQLSKLFSDKKNDKRSFSKLCNILENSSYGSSLENLIKNNTNKFTAEVKSRKDILILTSEIRTLLDQNNSLISHVINLRDKVYAHKDPNSIVQGVSFEDIGKLNLLSQEIFNLFQFRIFFTTTRFDFMRDWDIDYVLSNMSELRKLDLEELNNKKKGFL